MTTGLERIATKARSDQRLVFTSLAHHITPALVQDSLERIPARSSAGVDGMGVDAAKVLMNQWLPEMLGAVHRRGYKPLPVKRVYIPKPGKQKKRPIGIPSITDRCLQNATATVLNAIYEQDFLKCSMGGRAGRSAHQAVATLQ